MEEEIKKDEVVEGNVRLLLRRKEINSLEELRENFHIYELREALKEGTLKLWLSQHGYEKELKALETSVAWKKEDRKKKLYLIFDVPLDACAEYTEIDKLLDEMNSSLKEIKWNEDIEERLEKVVNIHSQTQLDLLVKDYLCEKKDASHRKEKYEDLYIVLEKDDSWDRFGYQIPIELQGAYYLGATYQWVYGEHDYREYQEAGITFDNLGFIKGKAIRGKEDFWSFDFEWQIKLYRKKMELERDLEELKLLEAEAGEKQESDTAQKKRYLDHIGEIKKEIKDLEKEIKELYDEKSEVK